MMRSDAEAMIALMGLTGTGKSTFIRLLTGDDNIYIGHDLDSATFDVDTSIYIDEEVGVCVTLLDTPGFDDSRKGVSDTDILGKIANSIQDGGGQKFNGIIYLHRISDPRFSGAAKKNLRIFRELCGDDKLDHVRFVTTYWNVVSEKEGKDREAALANGVFKPFIDAGAKLIRHDGGIQSAKKIISDLARKMPVKMKIQEELNAGIALGDTSAGAVIVEEMKELQKKHENEMEELKKELEAANGNDESLRAQLDDERQKLKERVAQVEEDRRRLATMRMTSDKRSQQNAYRVMYTKHEQDTEERPQDGGSAWEFAATALPTGERRERPQIKVEQIQDPPQVIHAMPGKTDEKAKARTQKDKRLDVEQVKSHHEDKRSAGETSGASGREAPRELQQRKEQISYPSRRSPDRELHNTLKDTPALSARQPNLERTLTARDKEVADLRAVLKMTEEDNWMLRRRREEERAALSVYQQDMERRVAAHDKEVADLRGVLKRTEESNGMSRRRWEEERAALSAHQENMKRAIAARDIEVAHLQAVLNRTEENNRTLRRQWEERGALSVHQENMERTIAARGKEVADLQAALKRTEESKRMLSRQWEEEQARLKREITRLEAELLRLNQDRNARLGENRSWAMKTVENPPIVASKSKGYFRR